MTQHGTFLYYLPGLELDSVTGRPTRAQIEERGLWDRLDDCISEQIARERCAFSMVEGGPDGKTGLLVVPQPHDGGVIARLGYYAEHQTWMQSQIGNYWIGTDNDHRPTPGGMARRRLVEGYDCELADGQRWQCPTIRTEILTARVPMTYGMAGESVFGQVQERYREVWRESIRWCVRFLEDYQTHRMVDLLGSEEAFTGCVRCLAINYRVGVEEVTLLRLLDDDSMEQIIDAAIDMPTFRDVHSEGGDPAKKKSWEQLLDGWRNSLRGSGDSTPDTPPAEPISN